MTTAIAKRTVRDEIFPIGGPEVDWVEIARDKVTNECGQCGRCCTAIWISTDIEEVQKYIKENPEPDPDWDEWVMQNYRDQEHIAKHFIPWDVCDQASRGLLITRLYYCDILIRYGDKYICPLHGLNKPWICSGYPLYNSLKEEKKLHTNLLPGCSLGNGK